MLTLMLQNIFAELLNKEEFSVKLKSIFLGALLAFSTLVPTFAPVEAAVKNCKIKVVGGSFKGHSMKIKMDGNRFVGDSSIRPSNLPGCRGMKYFYGRWYHMCARGTMIVYKKKHGKWVRLQPISLKKYVHNCF